MLTKLKNAINMVMKQVSVGVDIGGTNSAIGIVDEQGHVLAKDNISTPSHGDINRYVADLADAIKQLIANARKINELKRPVQCFLRAPTWPGR